MDYFHKLSRFLISFCLENGISKIIYGRNKDWKQNSNIGNKNNQNFVSIPFYLLQQMLRYKAALEGIEVFETEESYTSKCSYLDQEELCHQEKYLGKRLKRGLFKSARGTLINADTNGSGNIGRKCPWTLPGGIRKGCPDISIRAITPAGFAHANPLRAFRASPASFVARFVAVSPCPPRARRLPRRRAGPLVPIPHRPARQPTR